MEHDMEQDIDVFTTIQEPIDTGSAASKLRLL